MGKRVCPNLSQRRAVAAMGTHVTFPSHFRPFNLGNSALLRLASSPARLWRLSWHNNPKITDAPVYGRWKTSSKDTAEIKKLRQSGMEYT